MEEEFGGMLPAAPGTVTTRRRRTEKDQIGGGIEGTLLEDGIGDTIPREFDRRPEFKIPVCRDLVKRYSAIDQRSATGALFPRSINFVLAFLHTNAARVLKWGTSAPKHVPVVIADLSGIDAIQHEHLRRVGYTYRCRFTDKWNISDSAADYIFTGHQLLNFDLPGTQVIVYPAATWERGAQKIFSHLFR